MNSAQSVFEPQYIFDNNQLLGSKEVSKKKSKKESRKRSKKSKKKSSKGPHRQLSKWQMYVKKNYSKVSNLPQKQRFKELAKMFKKKE